MPRIKKDHKPKRVVGYFVTDYPAERIIRGTKCFVEERYTYNGQWFLRISVAGKERSFGCYEERVAICRG